MERKLLSPTTGGKELHGWIRRCDFTVPKWLVLITAIPEIVQKGSVLSTECIRVNVLFSSTFHLILSSSATFWENVTYVTSDIPFQKSVSRPIALKSNYDNLKNRALYPIQMVFYPQKLGSCCVELRRKSPCCWSSSWPSPKAAHDWFWSPSWAQSVTQHQTKSLR